MRFVPFRMGSVSERRTHSAERTKRHVPRGCPVMSGKIHRLGHLTDKSDRGQQPTPEASLAAPPGAPLRCPSADAVAPRRATTSRTRQVRRVGKLWASFGQGLKIGRRAARASPLRRRVRPLKGRLVLAIEPAVAVDVAAEASLGLLDHAVGLAPLSPCRSAGGLGSERWRVGVDVLLDAVARDLAHGAVPVLGALVLLGPVAEQLACPWRPRRRRRARRARRAPG